MAADPLPPTEAAETEEVRSAAEWALRLGIDLPPLTDDWGMPRALPYMETITRPEFDRRYGSPEESR